MQITPSSDLILLKGVPLDNTYQNTLYFNNQDNQYNYFIGKKAHTLNKQSYQRVTSKKCRVSLGTHLCYNCNYMMFKNTGHLNKWFYAFITSVEYVSETACEITYEIDVMQTWFFDYSVKECFVEREHSVTDNVGDNVVSEPVELGQMVSHGMGKTGMFDSYVAVVATAYDSDGTPGGYYTGLFSGVNYVAGLIDNSEQVNDLLKYLQSTVDANKQDSVVSVFVMPTRFYSKQSAPVVEASKWTKPTTVSGYTPKNKKLLTYPYSYLGVDCGNNTAIYKYEYFTSSTCDFSLIGCISCNPQIALVPMNYMGVTMCYPEKLVMSGFPQVAWSIDTYRAWLAQSSSTHFINGMGSAVGVAGGVITGNLIGATASAVGLANNINGYTLASNRAPQSVGQADGDVMVATRNKDFWFKRMGVTRNYAEIIDDYFTKYGYATNLVKVPNRNSRPYWNYVKTNGCCIVGNVPADDSKKIIGIYDRGVTFWKNGDNVGNYSLNNAPS